jgi:hypothetical protein
VSAPSPSSASGDRSGANTYHWDDWTLAELLAAKDSRRVSLVVPARNEAATVGDVVTRVREALVDTVALLDEIVVIDSDSTDATYDIATDAGAVVHRSAEIRPDLGSVPGKGEAMWKSFFVTRGEIVVFMDADLLDWDTHFVPGLLGPLLTRPEVQLVKGFYARPMGSGEQRAEEPRDEVGVPVDEVGVHEHDQVTAGDEQRLPHRLALARVGPEVGPDLVRAMDHRTGPAGHSERVVARVRVDDDDLVEERRGLHQRLPNPTHDLAHRRRLVAGRHHQTRGQSGLPLEPEQGVEVPVLPAMGARAGRVHPANLDSAWMTDGRRCGPAVWASNHGLGTMAACPTT